MKRIVLLIIIFMFSVQLVACTYKCSICGEQKLGFGGKTIEQGGRKVTVCNSCRDKISNLGNDIKKYFR